MKHFVLVTATKREMRSSLPEADLSGLRIGLPFSCPQSGLTLLVTGIGPINAAFVLGRYLGQAREMQGVINIGLAGSFDFECLALRQAAIVKTEICPEFGLRDICNVDPYAFKWGQGKLGEQVIRDRVELNPEASAMQMGLRLPKQWPQGVSLTVLGVTGNVDLARELQKKYRADIENMEGFALGWGCLQMDIPFLQVRCISNLVGSRDDRHWDLQGSLQVLPRILDRILRSWGVNSTLA